MVKLRSTATLDLLWECGDVLKAPLPRSPDSGFPAVQTTENPADDDPSSLLTDSFGALKVAGLEKVEPHVVASHGSPFRLDPLAAIDSKSSSKKSRRGRRGEQAVSQDSRKLQPASIRSLLFTKDEVSCAATAILTLSLCSPFVGLQMFMAVGLEDGRFAMFTPDKEYIRHRLQMKLAELGF